MGFDPDRLGGRSVFNERQEGVGSVVHEVQVAVSQGVPLAQVEKARHLGAECGGLNSTQEVRVQSVVVVEPRRNDSRRSERNRFMDRREPQLPIERIDEHNPCLRQIRKCGSCTIEVFLRSHGVKVDKPAKVRSGLRTHAGQTELFEQIEPVQEPSRVGARMRPLGSNAYIEASQQDVGGGIHSDERVAMGAIR
jgi:hypothetical protein